MNSKCIVKRVAAAVVAIILVAGITLNVSWQNSYAADELWDGYVEDETTIPSSFSVIDLNSIGDIIRAGAVPSSKYAIDGNQFSANWSNHIQSPDFWIKSFDDSVPSDWSKYKTITMKIYSAKATGASILALFYSPDAADGIRYFSSSFKVDWTGWKDISFVCSKLSESRSPTWKQITQLRLVGHGNWGVVGNSETELYIGSVKVSGYSDALDFVNDFYSEETVSNAYASLKDSVAVYCGGVNVVNDSGRNDAEYAFSFVDGSVTVPVKLFADYLGATVTDNGMAYSITLNGTAVSGSVGSDVATTDSGEVKLSTPVYASDSMCYVPGEDVAKCLGINAFTDGELLVMGTDTAVNTLRRPGNLGVNEMNEVVAYSAHSDKWNKDYFKPEDCEAAKDNWLRCLVGDETTNDSSDATINEKMKSIDLKAKSAWDKLLKDNESQIFDGVVMNNSSHLNSCYGSVAAMAYGYAMPGGQYYKNEELYNDIIYALDWLAKNYYNKVSRYSWVQVGFDDWASWDLGVAVNLVNILICIEDKLSFEEKEMYLSYYNEQYTAPKSTSANYIEITKHIIGSGLLLNDCEKVLKLLSRLQKEYLYVDDNKRSVESYLVPRDFPVETKGSGFFTDGSYIFHTLHPLNGVYASKHFKALNEIEAITAGTAFDIDSPFRKNLVDIYFNSFDPLIFEVAMFRSVLGRTDNPNNYINGVEKIINAFKLAENCTDNQDKLALYSAVKAAYLSASDGVKGNILHNLKIQEVKKFKEIMKDESIPAREPRRLSKVFHNADKTSHIRKDWAVSVSMSSSRIFNYECINGENLDGWYLSDGRTEYFLSGSSMNGTSAYWSSMDKYRFPGTTVDTQPRQEVSVNQGNEYLSSKDFVGGVMLGKNAEYSASAMDLESYHNDVDFGNVSSAGHGGKNPAHKSDLVAKKSYFMLDDGFICLGSGINAKNNNNAEVLTIVDNPLANQTRVYSGDYAVAYGIVSAVASRTPEPENVALNTIDGDYGTKWAAETPDEIVWDLGEVKPLGFACISLANGSKRTQQLTLQISSDNKIWETVFEGSSSGTRETDDVFDLKGKDGRYIKYINRGNNGSGAGWVSLTECEIYPPNSDGTIGKKEADVFGIDPITVDGTLVELMGDDKILTGSKWVNYNNQVGYYFPENASVNGGELKCRWTKSVQSHFELWFSHGVNPTDGGYAYVVLPGMTNDETSAFANSSNITILSNNKNIQAAKDNRTGITYITFWQPGSIEGITASVPCMVIARKTADGMEIGISDPTQKLKDGVVTINSAFVAVEADEFADVVNDGINTSIRLDFEKSTGRTYSFRLSKAYN